jgi:hypothetical protein
MNSTSERYERFNFYWKDYPQPFQATARTQFRHWKESHGEPWTAVTLREIIWTNLPEEEQQEFERMFYAWKTCLPVP